MCLYLLRSSFSAGLCRAKITEICAKWCICSARCFHSDLSLLRSSLSSDYFFAQGMCPYLLRSGCTRLPCRFLARYARWTFCRFLARYARWTFCRFLARYARWTFCRFLARYARWTFCRFLARYARWTFCRFLARYARWTFCRFLAPGLRRAKITELREVVIWLSLC